MPGFDRSGPTGTGAMTGGRRGFCNTTDSADASASGAGYGVGRGCRRGRFFAGGAGRGFGRGNELEYLTQEAQNLEKNLQMIKKRIDDLQQKSE